MDYSSFVSAGYSILPLRADGSKSPAVSTWGAYQRRFPSSEELENWFPAGEPHCWAVVCGQLSRLAVIDFDVDAAVYFPQFWTAAQQQLPQLLGRIAVVETPRPGRHLYIRCAAVPKSERLAVRPAAAFGSAPDVLIELRGEGAYAVCVGSDGTVHSSGQPYRLLAGDPLQLPLCTAEELDCLLQLCRSFNQLPVRRSFDSESYVGEPREPRPGDWFNTSVPIRDLLLRYGWQFHSDTPSCEYWTRPGKNVADGYSATLGFHQDRDGRPELHVHSSAAAPLEAGLTYGPFALFASYEHSGDFAAAAGSLLANPQAEAAIRSAQERYRQQQVSQLDIVSSPYSEITSEPVEWLWQDRVALGRLSLISGDPGQGKTFLACDLIARVSRGAVLPDGSIGPARTCAILTAEDDPNDTIRPRLEAAGADFSRVHHLYGIRLSDGTDGYQQLDFQQHMRKLEEFIHRYGIELLTVDPITAYLGKTNSHNNGDLRGVLSPLSALAQQTGCAILGITHDNKNAAQSALHRVSGSIAFVAAARAVWTVVTDPQDPSRRLFLPVKNNLASASGLAYRLVSVELPCGDRTIPTARLQWEPGSVGWEDLQAATEAVDDDGGATSEARSWLLSFLAAGPMAAAEIFAAAKRDGITPSALRRAKENSPIDSIRRKEGWFWSLSSEDTEPPIGGKGAQGDPLIEKGPSCAPSSLTGGGHTTY